MPTMALATPLKSSGVPAAAIEAMLAAISGMAEGDTSRTVSARRWWRVILCTSSLMMLRSWLTVSFILSRTFPGRGISSFPLSSIRSGPP